MSLNSGKEELLLMSGLSSKFYKVLDVAKITSNIVLHNIYLTMGIKLVFTILGVFGVATM